MSDIRNIEVKDIQQGDIMIEPIWYELEPIIIVSIETCRDGYILFYALSMNYGLSSYELPMNYQRNVIRKQK